MDFSQLAQTLERQGVACRCEEPMRLHTTFRVGGPAALFVEPKTVEEVAKTLLEFREAGVPWFLLGRGSNLLVGDDPLPLAVVHFGDLFAGIERQETTLLYAQSGASLMAVCRAARDMGLSGLEFAYGIPGAVGGGVYMNAGAYGGELKDAVEPVSYTHLAGIRYPARRFRGSPRTTGYWKATRRDRR